MKLFVCLFLLIEFIAISSKTQNEKAKKNFFPKNITSNYFNIYNKIMKSNNNSELSDLLLNKSIFCTNDCSNNGYCLNHKCYCKPGFYGEDCSKNNKKCINNCSEKGECINGLCACQKGYAGIDCSVSKKM